MSGDNYCPECGKSQIAGAGEDNDEFIYVCLDCETKFRVLKSEVNDTRIYESARGYMRF